MENTKTIGERAEGQVLASLLRAGKTVLLPFGDNQRYDLVVDNGEGQFMRVQCKNGRLRKGAIRFNACSTEARTGRRKGYHGDVDAFGVYNPDTDKVYLVPIGEISTFDVSLRLKPPKNNQKKRVVLAKPYEI